MDGDTENGCQASEIHYQNQIGTLGERLSSGELSGRAVADCHGPLQRVAAEWDMYHNGQTSAVLALSWCRIMRPPVEKLPVACFGGRSSRKRDFTFRITEGSSPEPTCPVSVNAPFFNRQARYWLPTV